MGATCGAGRDAATADACELIAGKTKSRIFPASLAAKGNTRDRFKRWLGGQPPYLGALRAPPRALKGRRRNNYHDITTN